MLFAPSTPPIPSRDELFAGTVGKVTEPTTAAFNPFTGEYIPFTTTGAHQNQLLQDAAAQIKKLAAEVAELRELVKKSG